MAIDVIHLGVDYSIIKVGGVEFEASLGLGVALKKELYKTN